jgi:uncharacterized damage-inducible protein DinB
MIYREIENRHRGRKTTMPEEVIHQSRVRPTYARDERELLDRWLEFHRATLIAKCEGLTDPQRKDRPVAQSELSLHGLVRHLAETERNWFQRVLLRDLDRPPIWPGGALVPLDEANWEDDLDVWRAECEASRRAAESHELDDYGFWRDKQVSLRSIYLHMIQEYARHNGHADFIRELEDGAVGL